MENVEFKLTGDKLVITIPDLKATGRPSSGGKSILVATTAGAIDLYDYKGRPLKLALNLTTPNR